MTPADIILDCQVRYYERIRSAPGTCQRCGGDGLDCPACERRGGRCVRCSTATEPHALTDGLCQDCEDAISDGQGPRLCEWCRAGTWEDGSLGDSLCAACRDETEEE